MNPIDTKLISQSTGIVKSIEYLHNFNQTDGSNTTDFDYGPQGAKFGTMTGQQFKRISWRFPLGPGDVLEFELSENTGQNWAKNADFSMICSWSLQTTTVYGYQVANFTATTADVYFGLYRNVATGAYGAAGYAWTGLSSHRWRVKKTAYY